MLDKNGKKLLPGDLVRHDVGRIGLVLNVSADKVCIMTILFDRLKGNIELYRKAIGSSEYWHVEEYLEKVDNA